MNNHIPHILVVEDEAVLRDVYQTILSMQGYRVSVARHGIEALEAINQSAPDVILLDVLMPEMGGLEFLRNFDSSRYPATKVIINSNVSDLDVIAELRTLGAHGHVLKSDLTPNSLIDLVESNSSSGM